MSVAGHRAICCSIFVLTTSAACLLALPAWHKIKTDRDASYALKTKASPGANLVTYGPWDFFAAFANTFASANPNSAQPFPGWQTNCDLWPNTGYCDARSGQTGPPVSEYDFDLDGLRSSSRQLPIPHFATTILYDKGAQDSFANCQKLGQVQPNNPCQSISAIKTSVTLVRAMWAEIGPKEGAPGVLPAAIYIEREVANCAAEVRWTDGCNAARRNVNRDSAHGADRVCNLRDYPWKNKAINLGCFPHIKVTNENAGFFQFSSGGATPGNTMILLAFHIMQASPSTTESVHWKQMTFWWQAKPTDAKFGQSCSAADACSKLPQPWPLFKLTEARLPTDPNSAIPAANNPYIEAPIRSTNEDKMSCLVCHAFAGYPALASGQAPNTGKSVGIRYSDLSQRLQYYLASNKVVPSAQVWSLGEGIDSLPLSTASPDVVQPTRVGHKTDSTRITPNKMLQMSNMQGFGAHLPLAPFALDR